MIRLLPVLLLLTACSNKALHVTETETECIVTGSLLSFDTTGQAAPAPEGDVQFNLTYTGDNCTVSVSRNKDP